MGRTSLGIGYVLAAFLAAKTWIISRLTDGSHPGLRTGYTAAVILLFGATFRVFQQVAAGAPFPKLPDLSDKKPIRARVAFLLSLGLVLIYYPGFVFFYRFPLDASDWVLQDPVISFLVSWPSLAELRTNLLSHGGLLWSSLRGWGLPILGNDVQAAPLFPLTLLLVWLPLKIYWNVFVVLRLALTGMAGILIGQRIFKFTRAGAILFALSFGFGFFVLRWINHPFPNSMLAGLWYFYFFGTALEQERFRFSSFLGTAVSAYALVTAGFPEAMLTAALILALSALPALIMKFREIRWRTFLPTFLGGTLLGVAWASPQLFALTEFVQTAATNFREGVGGHQFSSPAVALQWVIAFTQNSTHPEMTHYFGLIALFLCACGMASSPRRIRERNPWELGAWLAIALFALKVFPLWFGFNDWVSRLPVFRQTWFTVYSFPLPLWGVSYFSARGIDEILSRRISLVRSVAITATLLLLLPFASREVVGSPFLKFIFRGDNGYPLIFLFGLAATAWIATRRQIAPRAVAATIVILALLEALFQTPRVFSGLPLPPDRDQHYSWSAGSAELNAFLLSRSGGPSGLARLRLQDQNGRFAALGIATPDDGAPAILPERTRLLRTSLFDSPVRGYMPINRGLFPYSWSLVSMTHFLTDIPGEVQKANCPACRYQTTLPSGMAVYENTAALPRAYLAARCESTRTLQSAQARLSDSKHFHLGLALLEDLSTQEELFCDHEKLPALTPVGIEEDRGNRLRLSTIQGPGILVVNDTIYPG
ncbi:MAG: hypothetical protein ACXWP5_06595 [Bdellovibrionota bacterium]